MAITVTDNNPVEVTVVSDTVTTNTLYDNNDPLDRSYVFADAVFGRVNLGVEVSGFGLYLESSQVGGDVSIVNNGSISIDKPSAALELAANGGDITVTTEDVRNEGGEAIVLTTIGAGTVEFSTNAQILATSAPAVNITTEDGLVDFFQGASSFIADTFAGINNGVIEIVTISGDIDARLNGEISGGEDALQVITTTGAVDVVFTGSIWAPATDGDGLDLDSGGGPVTVDSSGVFHVTDTAIQLQAGGTELSEVNITDGLILADNVGISASVGTGGVLINMTGGQIGLEDQRGTRGIVATAGLAGNILITAGNIFSDDDGVRASIDDVNATGQIEITINGPIDSTFGAAIDTENDGAGSTTITVNDVVRGLNGIIDGFGDVYIDNNGTIIGTVGGPVVMGPGNDTYDGRNGTVIGGGIGGGDDDDLFYSGVGQEHFNGGNGVDTIDYDAATGSVIVSLAAEAVAGHGNDTFNAIENANGSAFADTFIGDASANIFAGRGGDDTYVVAPGGGADTVRTFQAGVGTDDRIDVRAFGEISSIDEFLALAAQVGSATVVDFGGGDTLTLTNVTMTDLVDDDLILVPQVEHVLWRHEDGRVRTAAHDLGHVANTFQVAATADLDGDGDSDVLWRHDSGLTVSWEMQDGALQSVHNHGVVPNNRYIEATGDFDGDGDHDILWHSTANAVFSWEMEDGNQVATHNLPVVTNAYRVAATGDFDNDGDDDIVWRHQNGQTVMWEMEDGAWVQSRVQPAVSNSFQIAGAGDFDGDGDADILWHHQNGAVVLWEMEDGAYLVNHNLPAVPHTWRVEGVQDLDHDGDADIVWRHQSGQMVTWQMQDASFAQVLNVETAATTWQIQGTGEFHLA